MDPFSIITGIGKQCAWLHRCARFVQQLFGDRFVVARPPTHHQAGRQHRATGNTQRQLDVLLPFAAAACAEVRTGRCALDSRRIDGNFVFTTLWNDLSYDLRQHRIDYCQRIATISKVFQCRVMRQTLQAKALLQLVRGVQHFDHASVSRIQVSPQYQAGHQLTLRELLRALGIRVGLHVTCGKAHAEPRDFNQSILLGAHANGLAPSSYIRQDVFNKANILHLAVAVAAMFEVVSTFVLAEQVEHLPTELFQLLSSPLGSVAE